MPESQKPVRLVLKEGGPMIRLVQHVGRVHAGEPFDFPGTKDEAQQLVDGGLFEWADTAKSSASKPKAKGKGGKV